MNNLAREALRTGARNMVEKALEDSHNVGFDPVWSSLAALEGHLPPRLLEGLTRRAADGYGTFVQWFFAQFALSCAAVADRLADEDFAPRCVAEEVALWFSVEYAKDVLDCDGEEQGRPPETTAEAKDELDDFVHAALQDTDFLMLWQDELDGVEDGGELADALGTVNLRMDDWFKPFQPRRWEPLPLLVDEVPT